MNNEPELIDRRTGDEDLFIHICGGRFRIHSAELKYLPEGCFSGPRNEAEAAVPRAITLGLEPAPDALAVWLDAHRNDVPVDRSGLDWLEPVSSVHFRGGGAGPWCHLEPAFTGPADDDGDTIVRSVN